MTINTAVLDIRTQPRLWPTIDFRFRFSAKALLKRRIAPEIPRRAVRGC